jgi:pimeloyl-ACP methyl ester carboxylesterase/membrane associated rhomboid family serine protease
MLKNLTLRGQVILAGVVFALAGFALTILLTGENQFGSFYFPIFFTLAWGAAGALVWWWLLRRGAVLRVMNGAAAGVLAGLLFHPFFWLLFSVFALFTDIEKQALDFNLNVLMAILFWPIVSIVSMLIIGWLTALVGGVIGGILGFLNRRSQVDMSEKPALNRVLRIAATTISVFAVLLLVIGAVPASTVGLESKPNPASDFAGGLERLNAIRADEAKQPLLEECRTQWKTHDQRTEKVVVFYHGLTNCPAQFVPLADVFFNRGYNVIIARHPYHVFADRDPAHLASLTAMGYRDMADASIDVAHGLGEQVFIVGLSGGGTVAAWAAQYRNDVTRSVMLAPFYGSGFMPAFINRIGINLLTRIPNITLPGATIIPYAYPGNTTRAMGETMLLGEAVSRLAGNTVPATTSVALLYNENDRTVNNAMAVSVMNDWARTGITPEIYVMPASLGLPHDIIDLNQEVKNPDLVYTAVVDIVEGREPTLK